MKTIKQIALGSILIVSTLSFLGFQNAGHYLAMDNAAQLQDTSKWVAPESAKDVVNPIESNETTIAEGLRIYKINCRSCHGKLGDGKGVESLDLETKTPDFRLTEFAAQTDGELFWKITNGRNDMQSFSKDLEEEEIWKVIVYIRTFSK